MGRGDNGGTGEPVPYGATQTRRYFKMPDNFLSIDAAQPSFDSGKPLNERVDDLNNYVFQLLEQLRYLFYNLDPTKNFNASAMRAFMANITDPIMARIEDSEKRFSTELQLMAEGLNLKISDAVEELQTELTATARGIRAEVADSVKGLESEIALTAEGLRVEVENAVSGLDTEITTTAAGIRTEVADAVSGLQSEIVQTAGGIQTQISTLTGDISAVRQTAEGIQTQVSAQDGRISSVTQTAAGLSSSVSDMDGRISTINQTVAGVQSTVSGQDGKISSLTQTAAGLSSTVGALSGGLSALVQSVNSIYLNVTPDGDGKGSTLALYKDGVLISSGNIVISGFVTFTDLTDTSKTIIDGGVIKSDTIKASQIKVSEITTLGDSSHPLTINASNLFIKGLRLYVDSSVGTYFSGGNFYLDNTYVRIGTQGTTEYILFGSKYTTGQPTIDLGAGQNKIGSWGPLGFVNDQFTTIQIPAVR
jgi:hypothetical protein